MASNRNGRTNTRRTNSAKPKTPIALPGEKAIRKTDRSEPVRAPRTPPEEEPRPEGAAVDQRKQFSGTDEHATDKGSR